MAVVLPVNKLFKIIEALTIELDKACKSSKTKALGQKSKD